MEVSKCINFISSTDRDKQTEMLGKEGPRLGAGRGFSGLRTKGRTSASVCWAIPGYRQHKYCFCDAMMGAHKKRRQTV